MRWFAFFAGTPRRALATMLGIAFLAVLEMVSPGTITNSLLAVGGAVLSAVVGLLNTFLGPIATALLPVILAGIGFRIMLKGFGGGGRRRRR